MSRQAKSHGYLLALSLLFTALLFAPPTFAQEGEGEGEVTEGDVAAKATPENVAEARIRYKRGAELYKSGDFKLALIEFNKAYAIAPHYKILYNIGQVNMQLNNYAAALTAFREYLKNGDKEIDDDRRAAIEKELPGLEARTAQIAVTANVDGAEVQIDNSPVGTTPMGAVLVDAGERVVSIHKDGRQAQKRIEVAGNELVNVSLELMPEAAPVVAPVAQPGAQPTTGDAGRTPRPDETSYVWVGWVVTGALTAAAIGVGIAALGAQGDLEDIKARQTNKAELDDASSKATSLSIATDVLIGAAVISGAVTLVFTISEATDDGGDELAVAVTPTSLGLRGTF